MPRLLARTPPFSSIDRAALTGALAVSIAAPGYVLVFGYGTNGLIPPGSIALGVLFAWTYWSAWESLAIHRETGGAAASISPEIDVFYTRTCVDALAQPRAGCWHTSKQCKACVIPWSVL